MISTKPRAKKHSRRDLAIYAELMKNYRKVPVRYKKIVDRFLEFIARHTDPKQAWFWTTEWQAKEYEANQDLKNRRYKTFNSMEDLLTDLNA